MTDRLDVIDVIASFADGEQVAASDLSAALEREDARAYLIDVLALRGLVTDAKPQTAASPAARAHRRWSSWRVVAAAALIVVGVAAGFTVGRQTAGADAGQRREGSGGREVGTVAAVPGAAPATPAAPAPTHVFRIENGVNWNERAGGN